ncbi:MAG: hypothetical protein CHACPFDD_03223 [Phycisphaerae bacterium]|nr:hypothetical protein [Phycisphaerae bacterium]
MSSPSRAPNRRTVRIVIRFVRAAGGRPINDTCAISLQSRRIHPSDEAGFRRVFRTHLAQPAVVVVRLAHQRGGVAQVREQFHRLIVALRATGLDERLHLVPCRRLASCNRREMLMPSPCPLPGQRALSRAFSSASSCSAAAARRCHSAANAPTKRRRDVRRCSPEPTAEAPARCRRSRCRRQRRIAASSCSSNWTSRLSFAARASHFPRVNDFISRLCRRPPQRGDGPRTHRLSVGYCRGAHVQVPRHGETAHPLPQPARRWERRTTRGVVGVAWQALAVRREHALHTSREGRRPGPAPPMPRRPLS